MNWKEFFASLVENLAWPLSILAVFMLLRDQITRLFEKIAHLKYKDLELDFEKVRQQAIDIQSIPKNVVIQKDAEEEKLYSSLEEQIFESIEKAPSASILLAWSALETAIASAVSRLAISPDSPSYRSPLHNIDMLEKYGELPPKEVGLLHEMRMLRNKVAHQHNATIAISEEQARAYAHTAIEMVAVLNGLKRTGKIYVRPKGDWSQTPEGFTQSHPKEAHLWLYSQIPIPNTNLVAGLGPWKSKSEDGDYVCYGIDVEMPVHDGSETISELRFSLSYVSAEALLKSASDLITYNDDRREITYNLGNSVFKYRLA